MQSNRGVVDGHAAHRSRERLSLRQGESSTYADSVAATILGSAAHCWTDGPEWLTCPFFAFPFAAPHQPGSHREGKLHKHTYPNDGVVNKAYHGIHNLTEKDGEAMLHVEMEPVGAGTHSRG